MKKETPPEQAEKQEVIHFLNTLDHPLKKEIESLREIILRSNNQITEHIKWKMPSFCHNGEDRITFNLPKKNDCVQLIFHRGAKVKKMEGEGNLIEDPDGFLKWAAPDRAIAKFRGIQEIKSKEEYLTNIIRLWLQASM